jgi:hypothetical protein
MSGWLVIVTGLIYAIVAIEQLTKNNMPMFVVYSGYAFSNMGLWFLVAK